MKITTTTTTTTAMKQHVNWKLLLLAFIQINIDCEKERDWAQTAFCFIYLCFKEVIWHTAFSCDNNYSCFVHTCTHTHSPIQSLSNCLCMFVSVQSYLCCAIHCSDLWIERASRYNDGNYKKTATSTNCRKLKRRERKTKEESIYHFEHRTYAHTRSA